MKGNRIAAIVVTIAALHVAVLSIVFGLRQLGYILSATLSATFIWAVVCLLNERQRRAGFMAGVVAGLAVQQVAYQVWKADLPGFWWPLAQFAALQFLIALGICQATNQVTWNATFHDQ